jgi:hypothetical protein
MMEIECDVKSIKKDLSFTNERIDYITKGDKKYTTLYQTQRQRKRIDPVVLHLLLIHHNLLLPRPWEKPKRPFWPPPLCPFHPPPHPSLQKRLIRLKSL